MDKDEVKEAHDKFMKSNARWTPRLMSIRRTAEDIGLTLGPSEDWMPVVIVDGTVPAVGPLPPGVPESARGQRSTFIIGFTTSNPHDKEAAAWIMRAMAVAFKATAIAFVSTVWMSIVRASSEAPEHETEEQIRERAFREASEHQEKHGTPSQDPNKIEKLMIISGAYGGQDDGSKTAFASIRRFKDKPPSLYDWAIMDDSDGGFIGRFPDAIMDGLKYAAMLRAEGEPKEGEEWKEGK